MLVSCRRHDVVSVEHARDQDGSTRHLIIKRILLADSAFTKLECSLIVSIKDIRRIIGR